MVIVPQEVSKPWPMAFGTLAGDIPDDARTSVSAREKVLILDFSTQPPARRCGSLHVKFRVVLSCFIILLLVTTAYLLLTVTCIVYCSLPPPPYAACAMPLRAHPLAAVCVAASGGWAPVHGARGKANQPLYICARTNWP